MNKLQLFNFNGTEFTTIILNGKPHWIAKEVCEELDIKNHSDATNKLKEGTQKVKLTYEECKQIGLTDLENLQIGSKGLMVLTESGIFKLAFRSDKPTADDFTDWISEEVLPSIRENGKYDIVEQKLNAIEDIKERELSLKLYGIESTLKSNPNDLLLTLAYNNTKQELNTYLSDKKIEAVNTELKQLKSEFKEQSEQLKKATALREGDMSAEIIARKLGVYSTSDIPHNRFADNLSKVLGFYRHPEGNSGYQDDYISINLENKYGKTTAVIKYSKLAFEEMEKYVEENGLRFEEPAKLFVKGEKKGQFNYAYLLFDNGERIKVNETTYKTYSKIYNNQM